jgi:hypothetical protein
MTAPPASEVFAYASIMRTEKLIQRLTTRLHNRSAANDMSYWDRVAAALRAPVE